MNPPPVFVLVYGPCQYGFYWVWNEEGECLTKSFELESVLNRVNEVGWTIIAPNSARAKAIRNRIRVKLFGSDVARSIEEDCESCNGNPDSVFGDGWQAKDTEDEDDEQF